MKTKSKIATIFSLLGILLLGGCNNTKDDKINYLTGDLTNTSVIRLSNSDSLETMRENGSSFVVIASIDGCLTCEEKVFPRFKYYIENYGLPIYRIGFNKLSNTDPLAILRSDGPVLGIYKEGKKLLIAAYQKNKSVYETQESFNAFFEKYVTLPSVFYISKDQLDDKIRNKKTFVILYDRNTCPDCSYLQEHFLHQYVKDNKDKTFYIIDCDVKGVRYDENGDYNQEQWIKFKEDHLLNKTDTNPYGYSGGVVPTFQYYLNGVLSASDVYVNESFKEELISGTEENGQKVTYKFTVTESFIEELINTSYTFETTYNEDTIRMQKYEFQRECVSEIHENKVKDFLDTYAEKKSQA